MQVSVEARNIGYFVCGIRPFSPTTWVVGVELRLSILVASTFTQGADSRPSELPFTRKHLHALR